MRAVALASVLSLGLSTSGATQTPEPLVPVRQLYLEAVAEESAIPRGMEAIEQARAAAEVLVGSPEDAVLSAYAGALITLRAKHGLWPPSRLRHLREGLTVLDAAVADHPDQAEIRYLRLLSCYFLPGILGRQNSVREDFAALALLLPAAAESFPPDLYGTMVAFVLENGALAPNQRGALEAAAAWTGDG